MLNLVGLHIWFVLTGFWTNHEGWLWDNIVGWILLLCSSVQVPLKWHLVTLPTTPKVVPYLFCDWSPLFKILLSRSGFIKVAVSHKSEAHLFFQCLLSNPLDAFATSTTCFWDGFKKWLQFENFELGELVDGDFKAIFKV